MSSSPGSKGCLDYKFCRGGKTNLILKHSKCRKMHRPCLKQFGCKSAMCELLRRPLSPRSRPTTPPPSCPHPPLSPTPPPFPHSKLTTSSEYYMSGLSSPLTEVAHRTFFKYLFLQKIRECFIFENFLVPEMLLILCVSNFSSQKVFKKWSV